MTAALEGGEWSAALPGHTLPCRKDSVPILQEAGWAPGPVWMGGKSCPQQDSIPDRPARSQSLYQLSYRAHYYMEISFRKWIGDKHYGAENSTDFGLNMSQMVHIRPPWSRHWQHFPAGLPRFVILAKKKKSVSSDCTQEVTAWFTSGFAANCLPATFLLVVQWDENRWVVYRHSRKVASCSPRCITVTRHKSCWLHEAQWFISPWTQMHPVCRRFGTDVDMKQVVTSWFDIDFFCTRTKALLPRWENA